MFHNMSIYTHLGLSQILKMFLLNN
jgi:hypothetical protein